MPPSDSRPPSSIRVSLKLPFSSVEAADYLFQTSVLREWLSPDSKLEPKLATHARLADGAAVASGMVTSLAWPATRAANSKVVDGESFEITVTLDSPQPATCVTFRLTPCPHNSCRLRIEQSGLTTDAAVTTSVKMWQGVINTVDGLVAPVRKRARRERQAVIVIHGIGEQRPGQLLRQFVSNVFVPEEGEKYFLKPDYVSSLFEMRMATVPRSDSSRPTTDVYELYWAHLIRDTTVSQVVSWMLRLLKTRTAAIPKSLVRHVWGLRIGGVVVAGLAVYLGALVKDATDSPETLGLAWLAVLAGAGLLGRLAWKQLKAHYLVGYVGDAARYLEPRPDNIARRQEIREAGAALLDALHDKGRYSRIIVYGHSLGSVIAYDMLGHAWARRARRRTGRTKASGGALRALENLLNPRTDGTAPADADIAQPMQHAAWLEHRRNGFDWLVSDLVTAGSPLAHAPLLLNLDATTQFANLLEERAFPTCPPHTETVPTPIPGVTREAFTFTHAYMSDEAGTPVKRSIQLPHHAGVFALTRWTNIYFPFSGLKDGDPIGGPLGQDFGKWVRDIPLRAVKGFAHSLYTDRKRNAAAVDEVRRALNLPFRRPLADLVPPEPDPEVPV